MGKKERRRMILTVKLTMPGAITERAIVTCYWGNPRYGTFIAGAIVAGVIAIWGAIVVEQ